MAGEEDYAKMEKISRVLVLPDLHIRAKPGGEDKRSLAAVEAYMADHKWDKVIQLGDFMDFNCVSSHNLNNLRAVEGETIFDDYQVANDYLDRWMKITGKAEWVILEGNHDFRIERYIDAKPEMKGLAEVAKNLRFKQRKINWVRYWSKGDMYKAGKALFIHGCYSGDATAKKHVMAYQKNVFYAHVHSIESYPLTRQGENDTIMGMSLGTLSCYQQSYLRGTPTKWQQAFGDFHFRPSGVFNFYVPMIFNHSFIGPNGKEYRG